jgi:hypothetical protein
MGEKLIVKVSGLRARTYLDMWMQSQKKYSPADPGTRSVMTLCGHTRTHVNVEDIMYRVPRL